MRLRLACDLIIIILFHTNFAIRQFNDEYPGVTVCESTNKPGSQYHMPYSYRILKGQFGGNHNCTHVEGNLTIENIWLDSETFDLSFLESIVEVSGMVYMKNNSIQKIILPNLRAIRGQYAMDTGSVKVSLSVDLLEEENSKYAILPNLIVISNHSVYFKTASRHKYLPHSINWEELFEYPEHQKLISPNKYNSSEIHQCNPKCSTHFNHCWSPMEQHCQKQTKCVKRKESCKWCFFKILMGEMDEVCCSDQCSGGCSGRMNTDCAICKTYINEKRCVPACPPEFISGKDKRNPYFKLRVGFICANACPENLLQEQDACIYSCTTPNFYRAGDKCLPCLNASICAGKECNIKNFTNDDNVDEFFMTKDILQTFTNCEHVIGEFHFTVRSFNKSDGKITTPMLYKHLKNVQFITGDLLIEGEDIVLNNLTFLQNLKEIRHQLTTSGTAALNVMHTDLKFLGLRKLRHIFGNFEAHENPNLCYLNTLNWNGNILKSNSFNPVFTSCNHSCDSKCDSQGCWGPGPDMCYNCIGFRAGYTCVDRCEDFSGFYTNKTVKTVSFEYDDGTCQPCNYLCWQNCTGPNPNDCIGGCRYFNQNNTCVKNCSPNHFSLNKNCYRCNKACVKTNINEPLCTGNGSFIGFGGCSLCNRLIYRGRGSVECYNHGDCPSGYYGDIINLSKFLNKNVSKEIPICRPCLEPCSVCTGNSTNRVECTKCKGYWSGDDCVNECFPAAQNLSIGDNCPYCNNNSCVDRCNVTSNYSFICTTCNYKRLYTNKHSHVYQCLSVCPSNRTYIIKEEDSKDMLCVTKSEYDEYWRPSNSKNIPKGTIVLIVSLIITFCLLSLFAVLYLNKINKKNSLKYLKAIYSNIHEPDSRVILVNKKNIPNMNRLLLIQKTNLVFNINDKPLGTGAFGAVYHGVWKSYCESRGKIETNTLDVAIKVIKSNKNIDINEILEEAKVMASVSHKHCLRLIGICLKYEMPCLVTAFVELGSLDKYLRKHKSALSSYILLSWGEQIANGMAYLEMRGIIHRDLAARNVLLNNLQLVQITDFGLAHILQNNEDNSNNNNEIVITGGQVPIRWLALETLLNGVYSHKTDVWAYGVTLWEIFTYGERPYDDMEMREVPSYLIDNNRLPQPEICSINVYELMNRCWDSNSNLRPPFEELMTTLSYFSRYPTYYLNIPNDSSLKLQRSDKQRLLSQNSYDFPSFPKSKDIYKQQSLDGTISTFVTDYQDDITTSSLRRQSSGLSWTSNKQRNSQDIDRKIILLRRHSAVSEDLEENENLFKSNFQDESDVEYLEPIKK